MTSILPSSSRSFLIQLSLLSPDPKTNYLAKGNEVDGPSGKYQSYELTQDNKNILSTEEICRLSSGVFEVIKNGGNRPKDNLKERVSTLASLEKALQSYATRVENSAKSRWWVRLLSTIGITSFFGIPLFHKPYDIVKLHEDVQATLASLQSEIGKNEPSVPPPKESPERGKVVEMKEETILTPTIVASSVERPRGEAVAISVQQPQVAGASSEQDKTAKTEPNLFKQELCGYQVRFDAITKGSLETQSIQLPQLLEELTSFIQKVKASVFGQSDDFWSSDLRSFLYDLRSLVTHRIDDVQLQLQTIACDQMIKQREEEQKCEFDSVDKALTEYRKYFDEIQGWTIYDVYQGKHVEHNDERFRENLEGFYYGKVYGNKKLAPEAKGILEARVGALKAELYQAFNKRIHELSQERINMLTQAAEQVESTRIEYGERLRSIRGRYVSKKDASDRSGLWIEAERELEKLRKLIMNAPIYSIKIITASDDERHIWFTASATVEGLMTLYRRIYDELFEWTFPPEHTWTGIDRTEDSKDIDGLVKELQYDIEEIRKDASGDDDLLQVLDSVAKAIETNDPAPMFGLEKLPEKAGVFKKAARATFLKVHPDKHKEDCRSAAGRLFVIANRVAEWVVQHHYS